MFQQSLFCSTVFRSVPGYCFLSRCHSCTASFVLVDFSPPQFVRSTRREKLAYDTGLPEVLCCTVFDIFFMVMFKKHSAEHFAMHRNFPSRPPQLLYCMVPHYLQGGQHLRSDYHDRKWDGIPDVYVVHEILLLCSCFFLFILCP